MHSYPDTARPGGIRTFFRRIDAWLDQRGKWAWIAAMVLAFVIFWPVGLALLAYMIWGKRMFSRSCGKRRHARNDMQGDTWGWSSDRIAQATGNRAFDTYKAEALRRLEDEQAAFEAFLERLRTSKDKAEFDSFMEDRARATAAQDAAEAAPSATSKPADAARPGEY
jgi:hypothetical protein